MTPQDFLLRIVDFLNGNGFEYVLTGSLAAAAVYGRPRLIKDFDLMVNAPTLTIAQFESAFPAPDFMIRLREVKMGAFVGMGYELTELHWGWRAELFILKASEANNELRYAAIGRALFDKSFEYRRRVWLGTSSVWLIRAEEILLIKLALCRYYANYRAKDYEDARAIVLVQGERLDFEYLDAEMEEMGLNPFWEKIKREANIK